ncbi:hypothetical protein Cme02nite_23980 [Catellatospora methionotrophica]|uniref:Uncharacterized protein n=1 Tax=Catellatospora methionotrophica TaxID=121620 RepID=A0A8J3PGB3_9ACTN|nr:hypothetical protein Cme02nite_23980 [Catellatospora methionotrophica]
MGWAFFFEAPYVLPEPATGTRAELAPRPRDEDDDVRAAPDDGPDGTEARPVVAFGADPRPDALSSDDEPPDAAAPDAALPDAVLR